MSAKTQVITGKVRASFVSVFRPRLNDLSGKEEYSVSLLISKSDKSTIDALLAAADAAIVKKWGSKDNAPRFTRDILRDGDEEKPKDAAYAGMFFINTKTQEQPGIVNAARQAVLDPGEFVSGDYCRADLNAYGYSQKGNSGVAFGLNNIQVLEKGEPLSSRTRAEDAFDDGFEADDDI